MGIERTAERLSPCVERLRCPVCGGEMTLDGHSLLCHTGHRFDLSRRGYVNLAPHKGGTGYRKELFSSRGRIYAQGFYRGVLEAVRAELETRLLPGAWILDAGCGQGYFARSLAANPHFRVLAMDLNKDAVAMASSGDTAAMCFVGDLGRAPLSDGAVDAVLNVLTPANYGEFCRVLRPGGFVVKVIPGESYLKEIRELAGDRLRRSSYSNQRVIDGFLRYLAFAGHREVLCRLPVDAEQAMDFLSMTPLTMGLDLGEIDPTALAAITIHLEILVGRAQEI